MLHIICLILSVVSIAQENLISNPQFKLNRGGEVIFYDQSFISYSEKYSNLDARDVPLQIFPAKHWTLGDDFHSQYWFLPDQKFEETYFRLSKQKRSQDVAVVIKISGDDGRGNINKKRVTDTYLTNKLITNVKKNKLYCFEAMVYGLTAFMVKDAHLMVTKKPIEDINILQSELKDDNLTKLPDFGLTTITKEWQKYRYPVQWASNGSYITLSNFELNPELYLNRNDTSYFLNIMPKDTVSYVYINPEDHYNSIFAIDNLKLFEISDSTECTCFKADTTDLDMALVKDNLDYFRDLTALRSFFLLEKNENVSFSNYKDFLHFWMEKNISWKTSSSRYDQIEILKLSEEVTEMELKQLKELFLQFGVKEEEIVIQYVNPYKGMEKYYRRPGHRFLKHEKGIRSLDLEVNFNEDEFKVGVVFLKHGNDYDRLRW